MEEPNQKQQELIYKFSVFEQQMRQIQEQMQAVEQGVIELKYGEPKIYSEGECIIVQANNIEEFKKNNDLLRYILLGVIE